ncbi:type II toxin-antitoxin system HicA family toxin [Candidatus Micrarchaeota archaeon]|nr:type II toxin-antitoxin system HicA family toxin [Candidatus Micrarchaeota archaeon]MBU1930170.1 type II toxin-antitoxin system HicA family toxin [Candidatus Micrarchaeota archaeon]
MKLPILSGRKLLRVLHEKNFELDHQTGSHFILRENKKPFRRVTIPNHKSLAPETLLSILKQAGLSREEFLALF